MCKKVKTTFTIFSFLNQLNSSVTDACKHKTCWIFSINKNRVMKEILILSLKLRRVRLGQYLHWRPSGNTKCSKCMPHLDLKTSQYHITPIDHFSLRPLAYLRQVGYLKVDEGTEPSAFRPSPVEPAFSLDSGVRSQAPSLILRLGLKLSVLIKLIVRSSSNQVVLL